MKPLLHPYKPVLKCICPAIRKAKAISSHRHQSKPSTAPLNLPSPPSLTAPHLPNILSLLSLLSLVSLSLVSRSRNSLSPFAFPLSLLALSASSMALRSASASSSARRAAWSSSKRLMSSRVRRMVVGGGRSMVFVWRGEVVACGGLWVVYNEMRALSAVQISYLLE